MIQGLEQVETPEETGKCLEIGKCTPYKLGRGARRPAATIGLKEG